MSTFRLKDFVDPIAITVQDPANSGYERFVGLEHYDSSELVIKRFSGVELLTTNAKAFQKNDLLIARRNVYLRRAGVVYFDGITSGDSIVLRVKEDCEKQTGISRELAQRVLPLVLNTDKFWIYANKHADGMNSKRISKDTLLDYEFDLPSIEEQKVLADKLWAAYKVKESYRQLLSTTDEMLKAKFQEMFGKGKGTTYSVKDLFDLQMGKTPDRKNLQYWKDGTNKWYSIADMSKSDIYSGDTDEYISDIAVNESGIKKVVKGTIFMSFKLTIGKVLIAAEDLYTNEAIMAFIPKQIEKIKLNQMWCFYCFKYKDWLEHAALAVKGKTLNKESIGNNTILLPPMELQQQFAEIATQAEATKASLRASIEAIDRVIRSLINQ